MRWSKKRSIWNDNFGNSAKLTLPKVLVIYLKTKVISVLVSI